MQDGHRWVLAHFLSERADFNSVIVWADERDVVRRGGGSGGKVEGCQACAA